MPLKTPRAVTGDGVKDLLLGQPSEGQHEGEAVLASVTWEGDVVDISIYGVLSMDSGASYIGEVTSVVPDITGDGKAEMLIAAPSDSLAESLEGRFWIVPTDGE